MSGPDLAELQDDLEIALADAIDGLPPGPRLYKRLRRIVESRLQGRVGRGSWRGIDRIEVQIGEGPVDGVVHVDLRLHHGAKVRHVRLNTTFV